MFQLSPIGKHLGHKIINIWCPTDSWSESAPVMMNGGLNWSFTMLNYCQCCVLSALLQDHIEKCFIYFNSTTFTVWDGHNFIFHEDEDGFPMHLEQLKTKNQRESSIQTRRKIWKVFWHHTNAPKCLNVSVLLQAGVKK